MRISKNFSKDEIIIKTLSLVMIGTIFRQLVEELKIIRSGDGVIKGSFTQAGFLV